MFAIHCILVCVSLLFLQARAANAPVYTNSVANQHPQQPLATLVERETGLELPSAVLYENASCQTRELGWISQQACNICPTVGLAAAAVCNCGDATKRELYFFKTRWNWRSIYGTIAVAILSRAKTDSGTPLFTSSEMSWVNAIVDAVDRAYPQIGSNIVMKYDGDLTVDISTVEQLRMPVPRAEFRRVADYFKANAFIETSRV